MNKLQQIQIKRGAYTRKRRKVWLWYKNRGLLKSYLSRNEKHEKRVIKTIELSWWKKFLLFIQKLFK